MATTKAAQLTYLQALLPELTSGDLQFYIEHAEARIKSGVTEVTTFDFNEEQLSDLKEALDDEKNGFIYSIEEAKAISSNYRKNKK